MDALLTDARQGFGKRAGPFADDTVGGGARGELAAAGVVLPAIAREIAFRAVAPATRPDAHAPSEIPA